MPVHPIHKRSMADGSKDSPVNLRSHHPVQVHIEATAFSAVAFRVDVCPPGQTNNWQALLTASDDPRVGITAIDARVPPQPAGTNLRVVFSIAGNENTKYEVVTGFAHEGGHPDDVVVRGGSTNADGLAEQIVFGRYV